MMEESCSHPCKAVAGSRSKLVRWWSKAANATAGLLHALTRDLLCASQLTRAYFQHRLLTGCIEKGFQTLNMYGLQLASHDCDPQSNVLMGFTASWVFA